jgi:5-methylcytosine-specific restriction endonuclease McrA
MEIEMEYQKKLLDPKWQQTRLKIFERDGWKCRICEKTDETLHAHHTYYTKFAEGPWDYDLVSIITLCDKCHADEHECIDAAKAALFNALAKRGYSTTNDILCLSHEIAGETNVY